jgi:hypothetical protein
VGGRRYPEVQAPDALRSCLAASHQPLLPCVTVELSRSRATELGTRLLDSEPENQAVGSPSLLPGPTTLHPARPLAAQTPPKGDMAIPAAELPLHQLCCPACFPQPPTKGLGLPAHPAAVLGSNVM